MSISNLQSILLRHPPQPRNRKFILWACESVSVLWISSFVSFFSLFFFFWPCTVACGILVPQPGIELSSPAVEAQSLNHWCAQEVPIFFSFFLDFAYKRCHISASVLNPWFLWSPKGIGKFFLLSGWNTLEHFKRGLDGSECISRVLFQGCGAPSPLLS